VVVVAAAAAARRHHRRRRHHRNRLWRRPRPRLRPRLQQQSTDELLNGRVEERRRQCCRRGCFT